MFDFDKSQRLCSKKRIETLFKQGKSFLIFPLSVRYVISQGEGKIATLVVCPKRYQKLAVLRNRIKRLIRENYRLNSHQMKQLAKENAINIDISFSYVNKQVVDFARMQTTVKEVLLKLQDEISEYTLLDGNTEDSDCLSDNSERDAKDNKDFNDITAI